MRKKCNVIDKYNIKCGYIGVYLCIEKMCVQKKRNMIDKYNMKCIHIGVLQKQKHY